MFLSMYAYVISATSALRLLISLLGMQMISALSFLLVQFDLTDLLNHQHSESRPQKIQEAQLLLGDRATRKHAKDSKRTWK